MHDLISLIRWVVTGVCEVHGKASPKCTAAKEVGTLATTTFAGAAIGSAIDGDGGTVPGGIVGFIAGLVINDQPQPT